MLAASLCGCATIRFYAQAAVGQASLLLARRDVQTVLRDPQTSPELAAQLRLAQSQLRFAEAALALPVDGRYRSYVDGADYPVWNVVAAEELALAPVPRCYPLVGCVIYRGFFSKRAATREAERLAAAYDVHLYPVVAYSTLGWFDDPLLGSFIHFPPADLAELLFHELAHGVLFVPGDTTFNESFARFVGTEGAIAWLGAHGGDALAQRQARRAARRVAGDFGRFLAHWRDRLQAMYALPITPDAKRRRKADTFTAMRTAYRACRPALGNGRYDAFMAAPFNNARLLAFGAYEDLYEGFARLFHAVGGDWPRFFERVRALGATPQEERHAALAVAPTGVGDHDLLAACTGAAFDRDDTGYGDRHVRASSGSAARVPRRNAIPDQSVAHSGRTWTRSLPLRRPSQQPRSAITAPERMPIY